MVAVSTVFFFVGIACPDDGDRYFMIILAIICFCLGA